MNTITSRQKTAQAASANVVFFDDEDVAAGADVVARLELRRLVEPELQGDHLWIGMKRVTAAHEGEVTMGSR